MKLARSLLLLSVALVSAWPLAAQQPAPPAARASAHETVSQIFDGVRTSRMTISYGRPGMKDRKIWGGLVPNGEVWRMGADEATSMLLQQAIEIGGTSLPAGAYSLDMLPEADGSAKLIIGKRVGQWGIPYDGSTEVARIEMKREEIKGAPVELFTIVIERNPAGGGVLRAYWENRQYYLPFTLKN